jgi:hypothetical protein
MAHEVEQGTSGEEITENEIVYVPLGEPGRSAGAEYLGFVVYLASMAAFLFWLLAYGVNV